MVGFYFKFKYSPKLTWSDRSQSNDCLGGSQGHSEKQTVLLTLVAVPQACTRGQVHQAQHLRGRHFATLILHLKIC